MARTSLPKVAGMNDSPGLGARNAASTFDALQGALQLYLKLKDKKDQDAIKERELTRQEASQSSLDNYYKALTENTRSKNAAAEQEDAFKQFNTTATNYAGARVPKDSPIVGQATKAGVDPNLAFTTEQTLPATRIPGGIGLPAGGQSSVNDQPGQAAEMPKPLEPNYFKPVPQEATGNVIVNPPESERMKIAALNEGGKNTRAADMEAGRNARAAASIDEKLKALNQSKWFRNIELRLRQAGVGQAAERIALAIATHDENITKDQFDMQLRQYTAAHKGEGSIAEIFKMIENDPSSPNPTYKGEPPPGTAVLPDVPPRPPRFGQPTGAPKPANPNDPLGLF